MLIASGLVFVLNTLLSVVVGVRLLRSRGEGPHPERLLALHFLGAGFVGGISSCVAYLGWSDPSLGIPLAATTVLNAVCLLAATVGACGVYLFTARTFHGKGDPHERAALIGACIAIGLMFVTYAAQGIIEGFAIRIVAGPIHWVGFSLRTIAFACAATESLRYYAASKKRLKLGLAEPIVTNRFLLWGIWSIATGLLTSSELIARAFYILTTGDAAETAEMMITVAKPLIIITVAITAVLGSIAVSLLFLTFFPTASFRRWLERSAPDRPTAPASSGAPARAGL